MIHKPSILTYLRPQKLLVSLAIIWQLISDIRYTHYMRLRPVSGSVECQLIV